MTTTTPSTTSGERFQRLATEPMVVAGQPSKVFSGTFGIVREILAHRQLLDLLIRRDLKSRYKDSALGFLWTLIRPITQLIIYYVVLGQILGAARNIPEFAVYIFSGLTIYGLLSEIIAGSTSSIVSNGGLIKKVYTPREIYPLASIGSALFNFGIQMVVLIGATIVTGSFPWHLDVLYFFPSVILILIYGTAFGLLLAALNVYLRDMQYLVEVLLMLAMWASPIVYAWTMVSNALTDGRGWLLGLYTDNPVTLAVLGFHRAFWIAGDEASYPEDLLLRMGIAALIGLVLLYAFHRVFARLQGNFAQEL
ncbi:MULTISPECIES: ABC transporter permease [unclassified Frigoribacterium]|jgi:ABC-2 type transport system permease protein|uniref:ABC transporter permease n=1 Tax=unclassified Frigoribacterium TaxID=2627005 RepID=UPI0005B7CBED|nr:MULTISPECIES: ABC transporter permease [unclassified Frigoribacterium]KIU03477.1 sugar ABC transporter [Frigoribacterium sp. MEB024]KQN45468.1 sugar ABC transporter [Frigoribacterium sp. Leaf44]